MFSQRVASRLRLMALLFAAGLIAVPGCSDRLSETSIARRTVADPPECRALLADDVSGRDFEEEIQRDHPPSLYLQFPVQDRELLRRSRIEAVHCRGGSSPETFRACNRNHCIMLELERRGWCWGGAGPSQTHDRWMRCSELPGDPPLNSRLPFSEQEIRDVFAPEAAINVNDAPTGATAEDRSPAQRFDLDCDLRGRVVSDPHPEQRHSSPMMDNDPWRERVRYVVDLEAMLYCDPASCRNQGRGSPRSPPSR